MWVHSNDTTSESERMSSEDMLEKLKKNDIYVSIVSCFNRMMNIDSKLRHNSRQISTLRKEYLEKSLGGSIFFPGNMFDPSNSFDLIDHMDFCQNMNNIEGEIANIESENQILNYEMQKNIDFLQTFSVYEDRKEEVIDVLQSICTYFSTVVTENTREIVKLDHIKKYNLYNTFDKRKEKLELEKNLEELTTIYNKNLNKLTFFNKIYLGIFSL